MTEHEAEHEEEEVQIHCGRCLFRSADSLGVMNGIKTYLCHFEPPRMLPTTRLNEQGQNLYVARLPTVRDGIDWCHGWIDNETHRTLEDVLDIN